MDGDDLLMSFRNAFLRTIARVWSGDEEFAKKVQTDPTGAMLDSGLNPDWPLELSLPLDGDKWEPTIAAGWCGSKRETITLRLPLDPAYVLNGVDQKLWAQALAQYYFAFPTLFGRIAPAGIKSGLLAEIAGFGDFREFGSVTVRAISMAWKSKEFRELLSTKDTLSTLSALQNWLGYTCPWNLDIEVVSDKNAHWTAAGGWEGLPRHKVTLYLPQCPPPDDPTVWPIALSAYNQTGPAYPFTCCT